MLAHSSGAALAQAGPASGGLLGTFREASAVGLRACAVLARCARGSMNCSSHAGCGARTLASTAKPHFSTSASPWLRGSASGAWQPCAPGVLSKCSTVLCPAALGSSQAHGRRPLLAWAQGVLGRGKPRAHRSGGARPWNPLGIPLQPHGAPQRRVSTSAATAGGTVAAVGAVASEATSTSPLVHGTVAAQRAVAGWILGCAAWTFAMVVLGGVTRLTRSGLSMTDWKFQGSLPPLTPEEWSAEFEKYKQFPEYKRVNRGLSQEEFKFIFWMEYAHRMWGRALGVLFAVPFAGFLVRGCLSRPLIGRLLLLFGLGGAQGFVGWWMVQSGLEEPEDQHKEPRVSPYRLAAHLTSAFVIYSLLIWTGLTVALPTPPAATMAQAAAAARARALVHPVAALVGVTAISGAFVAGNDAGRAYNTFPHMGDHWVPPLGELLPLSPLQRNFFESTAMVQLQHRVLALSSLGAMGGLFWYTQRLPLHPASRLLLSSALGVTALQVTLGISTLLTYVPVSLGSAHQAGALTLFTVLLMLLHTVRRPGLAGSKQAGVRVKRVLGQGSFKAALGS